MATRIKYDDKDREMREALKKGVEDYKQNLSTADKGKNYYNARKELERLSKFGKHKYGVREDDDLER